MEDALAPQNLGYALFKRIVRLGNYSAIPDIYSAYQFIKP